MKAFFYDTPDSNIDKSIPIQKLSLYEEFNTGSDEGAVTLNQVIATAEKVMGKKGNIQEFPVPPKGDAKYIGILDFSKAKNILGWYPQNNLEQGMIKLKAFYEGIS
jgi:nucleoside-diphosphate-sugar epimerase